MHCKNPTTCEGCNHGNVVIYIGIKALGSQQQTLGVYSYCEITSKVVVILDVVYKESKK